MPHPPLHGVDASPIDRLPAHGRVRHAGQAIGSTIANSPVATAT